MEQLKYREILNQEFKAYVDKPVKFKEHNLDNNILTLNFTNKMLTFTFFKEGIVKVFISDINQEPRETGAVC